MKLYKPNKSNKGSALSVNFSARTDKDGAKGDKSFYFQLVHQNGWNEKTQNGVFKDGKKVIVKFAPHEAAAMVSAINRNSSMADAMNTKYVYHDGDSYATTITFEPYFKSENKNGTWVKTGNQVGFSFKVTKKSKQNDQDTDTIMIGFNWGETELLKQYLTNGLSHICEAWRAENINRAKDYSKKNIEPVQESVENEEVPVEPVAPVEEDEFINM